MAELASSIKGHMIIRINDHPDIRAVFSGLPVIEIDYQYTVGGSGKASDCVELAFGNWPEQPCATGAAGIVLRFSLMSGGNMGQKSNFDDDSEVLYRYKYREINEGNLKIISEGTIRLSSPLDFNDPFDSTPAYDPASIEEWTKRRPDLFYKVGKVFKVSPAERIMNKGKMTQNLRRVVGSGEWSKALMKTFGVFCVSRNPCNALMWAHYANDHKGFLVEFKIDFSTRLPKRLLEPMIPLEVRYTNERPIIDWAAGAEKLELYLLTKSEDWAYEEEERILNTETGPGLYPYSRELFLHSVTAGVNMSDPDFELLKKAVYEASEEIGKPIPLYRAKLSATSYKVYIPGHPDPTVSSPE